MAVATLKEISAALLLVVILAFLVGSFSTPAFAQELEPRAYASSPVGLGAVALVYSRLEGGIVLDPTIPIEDITADLNTVALGFFKSFGLAGRMANFSVALPYLWGDLRGLVLGEFNQISRSGLGDARFRCSINLYGAPAMELEEFVKYRQKTNIGFSLTAASPTGQYDSAKLINIGANRWAFKPELGISHSRGKWLVEAAAGVWITTENAEFLGESVRQQDPVFSFQAHGTYNISRRMWIALNGNFYSGGRITTDGEPSLETFRNSRLGATYSLRLSRRHSILFNYSDGIVVRTGGKFRSIGVGYQFVFID